ncbi:MAG: DUF362 domain-containing protein [Verrucomicrobiae bacterium]|nr:DUF362 domain-containing protein [Verrucomicrobiae bacterium]
MTRVILILLSICQSFCRGADGLSFADPGVFGGVKPGQSRVVVVRDPNATQAFAPAGSVVTEMVRRGVTTLTGEASASAAWRSLIAPDDIVGIKVHAPPGPFSGSRPAVAEAVIRGLIEAGHPASRIVLWDRRLEDLRRAGFETLATALGVQIAGAVDAGFDPDVFYANPLLGRPVFGDLEFERTRPGTPRESGPVAGRHSHLSRLVTRRLTRHINIAPLLNHNTAGVSGILYTVASAATDNFVRFEAHASLLASAVPEIYGQPQLADRVALNIVDALVGQYEGRHRSLLHRAGALNQLRFSTDPVALDVLSIEELNRLRVAAGDPPGPSRFELYSNARLLELGTDDPHEIDLVIAP